MDIPHAKQLIDKINGTEIVVIDSISAFYLTGKREAHLVLVDE